MWWFDPPRIAFAAAALGLAACGFEPLYDPAGPAAAIDGRVEVAVIESAAGFALRERLVDRLGQASAPTHLLSVDLELDRVGVAITGSDVTTRFDVVGVASYRLVPLGSDLAVVSGETEAVTGFSAPTSGTTSTFAVLSAQRDAEERLALLLADRIAQRLAVDAEAWAQ